MDSAVAKGFLISKVVEQAQFEHVPLSEVERKMLQFTEVHPSLPDIYEVNAQFESTYDTDEYEAKVASLLKNARERDRKTSASGEEQWEKALAALKTEDHYILVMVHQAFGAGSAAGKKTRLRDFLLYVAIGVGLVMALLLASMWRSGH